MKIGNIVMIAGAGLLALAVAQRLKGAQAAPTKESPNEELIEQAIKSGQLTPTGSGSYLYGDRLIITADQVSNIRALNPNAGARPNWGSLNTQYLNLTDTQIRSMSNSQIPFSFDRNEQYSAGTWEAVNRSLYQILGY